MTIRPDMNGDSPNWPVYEIRTLFTDLSSLTVQVATPPGMAAAPMRAGIEAMARSLFDADWPNQSVALVAATEVSLVVRPMLELRPPVKPPDSSMTITSVTPDTGGVEDRTRVTIKGSGLSDVITEFGNGVTFRVGEIGAYASFIEVVDSETVTCNAAPSPDGPGIAEVTVHSRGGDSASLTGAFTYT
jgi:hypothetical protein